MLMCMFVPRSLSFVSGWLYSASIFIIIFVLIFDHLGSSIVYSFGGICLSVCLFVSLFVSHTITWEKIDLERSFLMQCTSAARKKHGLLGFIISRSWGQGQGRASNGILLVIILNVFGARLCQTPLLTSQFRLSVCPSVRHTSDPRLNGSRYRDMVYTTQCVHARGLLWYRVWRYGPYSKPSSETFWYWKINLSGKGTIRTLSWFMVGTTTSHYLVWTRVP